MRNYFIDEEKNEHIIDLHRTVVHSSNLVEYTFSYLDEGKLTSTQNIFVRKLAGQYFVSKIISSGKSLQGKMLQISCSM